MLLAIATLSLIYLVAAPSPWAEGLDTSRAVKESIRTRSWVIIGLWYGAAINLILSSGALLAWNFRPATVERVVDYQETPSPTNSRFLTWGRRILILAAMLTAAWAMLPRLDLSLWGDEEATTRRFLIGHVYRLDDGTFIAKHPSWSKAVWNFDNGPNSHLLFNVLARLSHGPADESGSNPDAFYFSERKIRLPSFLATLLMIPTAAWVVSLLGYPRGGPLVSFLLALHPWVIRFGSDARGYALQMLFGLAVIAFLLMALRHRGKARWWIAFGVSQALLLLSHLSGIYLLFPLNLIALWLAWCPYAKGHANPLKVANVWRYAGSTLLGAMISIQMLMPVALQVPAFFDGGRVAGSVGVELLQDWVGFWTLGTPWYPWEPGNPFSITWRDLHAEQPLITTWAAALLGLFFAAGIITLVTKETRRWWLIPLLTPALLMFGDAVRMENLLYPWYSVGFLPLAFIVVGIGFGAVAPSAGKCFGILAAVLPTLAGAVVVVIFALATQHQRQIYRQHSVEPLGEAVRLTREVVNPFHPRIDETLTLGYVHATRLYDPAMTLATNDEEFFEAIRQADLLNRPLWINAANLGLGSSHFPKGTALIEDRDVFDEPIVLYGLQLPCTRYVFRYRPGGLARYEARHPEPQ